MGKWIVKDGKKYFVSDADPLPKEDNADSRSSAHKSSGNVDRSSAKAMAVSSIRATKSPSTSEAAKTSGGGWLGSLKSIRDQYRDKRFASRSKNVERLRKEVPLREEEARLRDRDAKARKSSPNRAFGFAQGVVEAIGPGSFNKAWGTDKPGKHKGPVGPVLPDPFGNDPYGHMNSKPHKKKKHGKKGKGGNGGKEIHIHLK
jgi:hypothetical protein